MPEDAQSPDEMVVDMTFKTVEEKRTTLQAVRQQAARDQAALFKSGPKCEEHERRACGDCSAPPDLHEVGRWLQDKGCPLEAMQEVTDRLRVLWSKDVQWQGEGTFGDAGAWLLVWEGDNPALASIAAILAGAEHDNTLNPLAPLMRAWSERPIKVTPDRRKTGILPASVLQGPLAYRLERDLQEDTLPIGMYAEDAQLPLLTELEVAGRIRWSPIVRLVKAADMDTPQPGRGARLDKRLLVYSLLRVPPEERRPGGHFTLEIPLEEIVHEWLWPKNAAGRSSWRPVKHGEPLRLGFSALSTTGIVLPNGAEWRPALVRQVPYMHDQKSKAIIEIALTDGSGHGPLISRPHLYAAGVLSDPAFDLEVSLSYLWDRAKTANGGHRVYATRPEARRDSRGRLLDAAGKVILWRGRPVTDWSHKRAVWTGRTERHPQADRVPMLGPAERHALAFDPARKVQTNQRTNERARVDAMLKAMEKAGRVVIERDGNGWRILEAWTDDGYTGYRSDDVLPCVFRCSTLCMLGHFQIRFSRQHIGT